MQPIATRYTSKAVRVSESLKRDIQRGRLGKSGRMPSIAALARKYEVSQPTLRRVLDLLRVSTNNLDTLLTRSSVRQIAFVTPNFSIDVDMQVRGAYHALQKHGGYVLATYSCHGDLERYAETIEDALNMNPAGIILGYHAKAFASTPVDLLNESGVPVVIVGSHDIPGLGADRVDGGGRHSGPLLARYILEHGYRDLALISAGARSDEQNLIDSLRRELAPVNIELPDDKIVLYDPVRGYAKRPDLFIDGQQTMAKLLDEGFRCQTLVCGNDTVAVGALRAVLAAGLRVPQDVRILSDYRTAVEGAAPMKITTVDHHQDQRYHIAAELVIRRLKGDNSPKEVHYGPVSLIQGETG